MDLRRARNVPSVLVGTMAYTVCRHQGWRWRRVSSCTKTKHDTAARNIEWNYFMMILRNIYLNHTCAYAHQELRHPLRVSNGGTRCPQDRHGQMSTQVCFGVHSLQTLAANNPVEYVNTHEMSAIVRSAGVVRSASRRCTPATISNSHNPLSSISYLCYHPNPSYRASTRRDL